MAGEYETHTHEFPPFFDRDSRILILGSFPSVSSREAGFYYGHPRNRFWKVLAAAAGEPVPDARPEKEAFLRRNRIALWDVIESCEIIGSSDSSIRSVVPTDLSVILDECRIGRIYANGALAGRLFRKYQSRKTGREITVLPSTSPANAAWSFERLLKEWRAVGEAAEEAR